MNTLITPGSGNISFSKAIFTGSDYLPPLSSSARIAYTKDGGLTIVSTASGSERFNVEGNFGNLLTVNDSATGRLFVINDVSGFPLFFITDNGSLSSASVLYASGGNSDQWNSTYTTVNNNSAGWENIESFVTSNSATWDSTTTTVRSISARSYQSINKTFSAYPGEYYLVDTSTVGTITAALPPSPTVGDNICFADAAAIPRLNKFGWSLHSFTINRNGNMIEGLSENLACDVGDISFCLTYIGGSVGWKIG